MTLVELRPGEKRAAMTVFLAMVLVVAAHTSLETVRDALFLTRLGPGRLAAVMGLLALLSLGAARANIALMRAVGRRDSFVFSLVGAAWGTGIFAVLPTTATVIFVLYLFSALMGNLLLAQLWISTGDNFTVAQGRRLFPFIGAGAVIGAIFGAFGTAFWLAQGNFRPLLVVSACLFLATGLLMTSLPIATDAEILPTVGDAATIGTPPAPLRSLFQESPYVLRVGMLVGIATATVLIADYLFKTRVAVMVPKAELGVFLARFYGAANVAALVVQLVIARPLLRRLGVAGALLVMPIALLAGAGGIVLTGGVLAAVLVTKGIDGSLRHSLQRLCTELIVLPLSADLRSRSKPLFEGVFGRGVQALVSLGLLGLASVGLTTGTVLGAILGCLALAWVGCALAVRKPYLDLFRQALTRGTLERGSDLIFDRPAIEAVQQALSSLDDGRVGAAMDLLKDRDAVTLIPGLILFHESEAVLAKALAILGPTSRDDWQPLAERLLIHPVASVRMAAIRALGPRHEAAVTALSNDTDPGVRALVAFALATDGKPEDNARVAAILDAPAASGARARTALLAAIAADGGPRWSTALERLIELGGQGQQAYEASAIARVGDPRFLPRLIQSLAAPRTREGARTALLGFGTSALDALAGALADTTLVAKLRREIPLAIARFSEQRAADVLLERLATEPNGAVRFRILRGLNRLGRTPRIELDAASIERELRRNLREHARVSALRAVLAGHAGASSSCAALLNALLKDKALQAVERAFRLLQLAHRGEDVRSLYYALQSTDLGARANAYEFLDALTTFSGWDQQLHALLRLATDDLSIAERGARAFALVENLPDQRAEVIALLSAGPDAALAELASRLGESSVGSVAPAAIPAEAALT